MSRFLIGGRARLAVKVVCRRGLEVTVIIFWNNIILTSQVMCENMIEFLFPKPKGRQDPAVSMALNSGWHRGCFEVPVRNQNNNKCSLVLVRRIFWINIYCLWTVRGIRLQFMGLRTSTGFSSDWLCLCCSRMEANVWYILMQRTHVIFILTDVVAMAGSETRTEPFRFQIRLLLFLFFFMDWTRKEQARWAQWLVNGYSFPPTMTFTSSVQPKQNMQMYSTCSINSDACCMLL